MCLGIPGQVVEIVDAEQHLAKVDVNGVQRIISVRLLAEEDLPERRLGARARRLRDGQDRRGGGAADAGPGPEDGRRLRQRDRGVQLVPRSPDPARRPGTDEDEVTHEVRRRVPRPGRSPRPGQVDHRAGGRTDHFKFMEVCGGHTHTIYRHGIEHLLPPTVELVHGPGCPVCVIPMGRVDDAMWLAEQPDVIFTSFGDMMRVPGRDGAACSRPRRAAPTCASSTRRSTRSRSRSTTPTSTSCSSPSASRPPRRPPR